MNPESANFVAEFKALAERDKRLAYPKRYTHIALGFIGTNPKNGIGRWKALWTPSQILLAEFIEVATRAGNVLTPPPGVNPFDYFLDCVYTRITSSGYTQAWSPLARASFLTTDHEFGRIMQVCEAAAIFWLERETKKYAEERRSGEEMKAGPDIHVDWGYYPSGGILLFRNEGIEAAKNIRLRCSESGWGPFLSPEAIPSIPPGGHFWAIDGSKSATAKDWDWPGTWTKEDHGQSIAEFVDSLSNKQLTMTLVFEDQSGEQRAREVRVEAKCLAPEVPPRARFYLKESPISTVMPEPDAEDRNDNIADQVASERRSLLARFKALGRTKGIKVTDKMVAKAANPGRWNERSMVTWWKANDPRCKKRHDTRIRAVLGGDPSSIWPSNVVPRQRAK